MHLPKITMKMSDWIALLSAVVAAVSAYYAYQSNIYVQDRQATIEELRSLDDASQELLEAGAAFVAAINKSADLKPARDKLNVLLAQQAIAAINTRRKLRPADVGYAEAYAAALRDFNRVSQNTNSVTEMRPWVEAFGRVLDARTALTQAIAASVGRKA